MFTIVSGAISSELALLFFTFTLPLIFGAMSKASCIYYLRQEGDVFTCVCLFVCLLTGLLKNY